MQVGPSTAQPPITVRAQEAATKSISQEPKSTPVDVKALSAKV